MEFTFDFCLKPFQVSIPAWFTVDTRLGSLSVHLDTPQCFSAEIYSADLNITGKPEDDKVLLVEILRHRYLWEILEKSSVIIICIWC